MLKQELETQKDYIFITDKITYSSVGLKGDKQSYVTGYISVPEIDLYNDLVTPTAMKSMLRQITEKTIVLDYEHESFRDDNTILPVGKIVEAHVDDRGLWVKCKLNSNSPKYKALWGSIKDGFLNAFSIAFKPLRTVEKSIGDTTVRLIEDLELLNVALTGTPVNTGAVMTGHSMKAVMLKAIEDTKQEKVLVTKSLITKLMEEKNMAEENVTEEAKPEATEEAKTEEVVEEKSEDEPAEEVEAEAEKVEEKSEEEATPEEPAKAEESDEVVEEKALDKVVADLKAKVEAQAKELKTIKESPVFKSTLSDKPLVEEKSVDMLDLVR